MRKYLLLLSSCLVSSGAASAAHGQEVLGETVVVEIPDEDGNVSSTVYGRRIIPETSITVTATGNRSEVRDTGQPVTVIGEDEIESIQGADITRVLRRSPGVTITRNGGVGAVSSVRVRGAPGEQLLALIDGVRVADPAAPSGGYDFGNLLTGNIAKLDLLRGSNSTIWGSDAIGGVLAVTTDTQEGAEGSAEYGARDTVNLTASAGTGIGDEKGFVGISGSYFNTDGFSAAAAGTENDGFEQWAVNGQARAYLSYSFELFARARYSEGDLEVDGFPAPAFALADTDEFQQTRQYSASAGAQYESGALLLKGLYSFADTERENFNPAFGTAPGFTADGHSDRVEIRGEWRAIGPVLINFGAEQEWTAFETNFDARQETNTTAAYVQAGFEFSGITANLGVRQDDHARFGGATSFGADATYEIINNLRLRASIGEGFKTPTLFQLFSDFGNEALRPEKATSFDVGLSYSADNRVNNRGFLNATLFRRDSQDLIAFISCFGVTDPICVNRPFGTYDNVGLSRSQGVEIEGGIEAIEGLYLRGAYTFIDIEDRSEGEANSGNRLARVPRHATTLSSDWDSGFDLRFGADIRYVSSAFDDAANTVRLKDYALIDLRASYALAATWGAQPRTLDIFGRVENITNEDYQTAAGFNSPGRGVFVGIRAEM